MLNKCYQCGICCRLFLVNLTEEEYRSNKYKTQLGKFGLINDFKKAAACGASILKQTEDGSCVYLEENKCSIHKTRPQACKEFFCSSKLKRFKIMIRLFKKYCEDQTGPDTTCS
jgi:Fe-S-cluster containining protein